MAAVVALVLAASTLGAAAATNSSRALRGLSGRGSLDKPFVLVKDFDLSRAALQEFDVTLAPDANSNRSCANYVDDGTTVFTRDGSLVLKVSSACPDGRCLNSGRVMSRQGFKYGVFVFKAKVPKCNHIWPSLWLLPNSSTGDGAYGTWPCSGEIDVLQTVHGDSWGAFNLVTGFGANDSPNGYCANPEQPACNRCAEPAYCTSTTLEHMTDSFYHVEDVDCSAERPSWSEHTFVLSWQPDTIATWVDPDLTFDWLGQLTHITPNERSKVMKVWGTDREVPSWKSYERESTPAWTRIADYMGQCYPEDAGQDAPFDKDFKIVMNIAVGGYGGAPCTWDSESCSTTCGGAVGSELVISELKVYERTP